MRSAFSIINIQGGRGNISHMGHIVKRLETPDLGGLLQKIVDFPSHIWYKFINFDARSIILQVSKVGTIYQFVNESS